jgi:hypothetical protein
MCFQLSMQLRLIYQTLSAGSLSEELRMAFWHEELFSLMKTMHAGLESLASTAERYSMLVQSFCCLNVFISRVSASTLRTWVKITRC